MAEEQNHKRRLWDRLRDTYRITILDEENLEEIGIYNLSLLTFYIFVSVFALILSTLVISFIIFTPVKRLIPGYGDITDNKKFIELIKKVNNLEQEVAAYDTYTSGLKTMLTGGLYTASVEKIDSMAALKNMTPQMINQAEISEVKRAKELSFLKFATPLAGKISAKFSPDIQHYGVDIIAPKDSPIKSIMDGIVINADQSFTTGYTIYIQHTKNLVSAYKHNSALLVKTGTFVKAGQSIAIIGNSGEMSTGPHLHFEMWYDGKFVNPENYVTFR